MNRTRRWLLSVITGGVLTLAATSASATQPVVEIIAYAHPPVQSALKPLRDWLATQNGRVRVNEIDMDSAAAVKRLDALGLKGHIPVVVVVNGSYRYKRKDGTSVEFVGFPSGPGTPAGVRGIWSAQDVQAAIATR